MDKLFQTVSNLLSKGKRIEVYSSLNVNLINDSNVVLWDKTAASINDTIYNKFRDALKQRTCKFYTINSILPYHDFCIALLCCVGYSLNHNSVSKIGSRTFKSAWRTMAILTGTGDKEVQEWIRDRIQDRDPSRYSIELDLSEQESPTVSRRVSLTMRPSKYNVDEDIISRACSSKDIKEVTPDSSIILSSLVNKVTSTPEGQLDNLRIIHMNSIGSSF